MILSRCMCFSFHSYFHLMTKTTGQKDYSMLHVFLFSLLLSLDNKEPLVKKILSRCMFFSFHSYFHQITTKSHWSNDSNVECISILHLICTFPLTFTYYLTFINLHLFSHITLSQDMKINTDEMVPSTLQHSLHHCIAFKKFLQSIIGNQQSRTVCAMR